jgi:hypothetical protein
VEQSLSDWLKDASQAGSGDDITMGIVFPVSILPAPAPEPPPEAQSPKPHRKSTSPQTVATPKAAPRSTVKSEEASQPVPDEAQPSTPPEEIAPPEEPAPPEKKPKEVKKDKAEAQEKAPVPPEAAAEPESDSSAESAPEDAEATPAAPPPEEEPAEPPAKPRIELIKNEDRPREPSKTLPNIFYDD